MNEPVGFVGTGTMGTAIATRLLDSGHKVFVHNRTRSNSRPLEEAGATWVQHPSDLAARCPTVLGCLRNTTAVTSLYLDEGGLLDAASYGQVFVEHGTFAPSAARAVAARAWGLGAAFLDAPVTGGPDGARAGTLAVMVGGDPPALEKVEPLLRAFAGQVTRVGGSGTGLELKLVNQLLTSAHMAIAAEAVALLKRLGIPLSVAAEVLDKGWAQSAMFRRSTNLVEAGIGQTGATVAGMLEVLDLVTDLRAEQGLRTAVFDAARASFETSLGAGLGNADPAALFLAVLEEGRLG